MLVDAPAYFQQERVECSIQAAHQYQIPILVLLAVAEQEGGKPGQRVRNRNGTFDYGVMQINTVSLADLRRYGIHEKHVLAKGCYPYTLAAWRIAGHLQNDSGDIWQRVANYHSRTTFYNRRYRNRLILRAYKIVSRMNGLNLNTSARNSSINPTARQIQPNHVLDQVTLTTHDQTLNAYSAPIRIKSFDALNEYAQESEVISSPNQASFPVWW